MQQDKDNLTINLTVPTGWDKLDDYQLRYVFGLLAQGFPSPQVKTYCLFRWTGMQVMHKYGKGWWCKFADDEFVIMAEQVNAAIAALGWIDSLPSKPVRISRIGKHRALTADFQEVPFETFIICDNLYQGYLSAKDDQLLDDLARFAVSSDYKGQNVGSRLMDLIKDFLLNEQSRSAFRFITVDAYLSAIPFYEKKWI